MKIIFALLLTGSVLTARADTIALRDGTKLEGSVEGEMDGVALVKTRYGTLNINKSDIVSQQAQEAPAVSTAAAAAEPRRTFSTVATGTSSFERIYFEDGVIIATETVDLKGQLLELQGFIKDAAYKEYYDNGNIKTEKTFVNAELSGALKTYYPTGVLQSEAHYAAGVLNGPARIYNETGKPLLEQNFRNGVSDGWFREFDETGGLKSELFYRDGRLAEKPGTAEGKKTAPAEAAAESLVTAKAQRLARGERFTFYLNGKYAARLLLDKDFNIISKEGTVPDGTVKVYNKDEKLEKEFVFDKNDVLLIRIFSETGALMAEISNRIGRSGKR